MDLDIEIIIILKVSIRTGEDDIHPDAHQLGREGGEDKFAVHRGGSDHKDTSCSVRFCVMSRRVH